MLGDKKSKIGDKKSKIGENEDVVAWVDRWRRSEWREGGKGRSSIPNTGGVTVRNEVMCYF